LFGEAEELASGNFVTTLHGTSGGERPAGTTLALILDGGDGTLGAPVDSGRVRLGQDFVVLLVLGHLGVSKEVLVLPVGPVGHLVVAEGEVSVGLVVLLYEGLLLEEVGETELVLLHGVVDFTVFGHELLELEVVLRSVGGGEAGEGSDGERLHLVY